MAAAAKKETNVEQVKMEDGSVEEFTESRKAKKETWVDREANTCGVVFKFRNGAVRKVTVHSGLMLDCAAHGMSQKVGDEYSGEKEVDDMLMNADAMIERLNTGDPAEWRKRSEAGAFSGASILLQALCLLYPAAEREQLAAYVKGKTPAERSALERTDSVAPFVAQVKAERDKKRGIDGSKLADEAASKFGAAAA